MLQFTSIYRGGNMNIFKKIQTANKLLNVYLEIKTYIDNNKISNELKEALNDLKSAVRKIIKIIPKIGKSVDEILEIAK